MFADQVKAIKNKSDTQQSPKHFQSTPPKQKAAAASPVDLDDIVF
jgi:hypothetical protein